MEGHVRDWFYANEGTHFALLRREYEQQKRKSSLIRDMWNLSKRNYSEMPLCTALTYAYIETINFPEDYFIPEYGAVRYSSFGKMREDSHHFAMNRDGYILCITAGQFIEANFRGLTVNAGYRMSWIQQRMPESVLISNTNPAFFLINAQIEDIKESLRIEYAY